MAGQQLDQEWETPETTSASHNNVIFHVAPPIVFPLVRSRSIEIEQLGHMESVTVVGLFSDAGLDSVCYLFPEPLFLI